jgi:hypothetical protein
MDAIILPLLITFTILAILAVRKRTKKHHSEHTQKITLTKSEIEQMSKKGLFFKNVKPDPYFENGETIMLN